MCIIVNKPEGIVLPESTWTNCFANNDDGAGFVVCEEGRIRQYRGYFRVEGLLTDIKKHENKRLLVHFRLASHGEISKENCHPFIFNGGGFGWAVAHNGILAHRSTKELSDTRCFVDDVLDPLLSSFPDLLDLPAGFSLLESRIGSSNKIVILRSDGKEWVLNKQAGETVDGVWYSNGGWRYDRSKVPAAYKGFNAGNYYGMGGMGSWSRYDYDDHRPAAEPEKCKGKKSKKSAGDTGRLVWYRLPDVVTEVMNDYDLNYLQAEQLAEDAADYDYHIGNQLAPTSDMFEVPETEVAAWSDAFACINEYLGAVRMHVPGADLLDESALVRKTLSEVDPEEIAAAQLVSENNPDEEVTDVEATPVESESERTPATET